MFHARAGRPRAGGGRRRRSSSARRSPSGSATGRLEDRHVPVDVVPIAGERWQPVTRGGDPVPAGLGHATGRRRVPVRVAGPLARRDRRHRRPARDAVRRHRPRRPAGLVRSPIRAAGRGIRGIVALGGPTRGRLRLATGPDGELRPGGLDVGLAGTILVVGSRVDAETLTRARAMGVRGVVVAGLASKERRDFLASEARQRAALHRLPPFAVLVLDGATRRPMAAPSWPSSRRWPARGRDRRRPADARVRPSRARPPDARRPTSSGSAAATLPGARAAGSGAAGPRRFAGGVDLEAGCVRLADGTAPRSRSATSNGSSEAVRWP